MAAWPMLEALNLSALAAFGLALAFALGWAARGRELPPPAPSKRPLGAGAVSGKTAAGLLGLTMAELGGLVAEGKIRAVPGGLAISDVHAILAARQLEKDLGQ